MHLIELFSQTVESMALLCASETSFWGAKREPVVGEFAGSILRAQRVLAWVELGLTFKNICG
jgi:hypothetical protein